MVILCASAHKPCSDVYSWSAGAIEGASRVARTLPFHSVKEATPNVFHTNDACHDALRIERTYWRAGAGDRHRLCEACEALNAEAERAQRSTLTD